jgi:tetratricopeptide (TPR) repeat protein
MKRSHLLGALVLGLAAVGASAPGRPADTEALLRAGNAAFAAGDFGRAAALYEQAQERASDPAQATFNLAAAKYRLALQDNDAAALREAEQYYRCCVGPEDPRRARALFGLGNCLLRRASGGAALDANGLRVASACYQRCLGDAQTDPALAAEARHNLQRARLLLVQARAPASAPPEEGGRQDEDRQPDRPESAPKERGGEPGEQGEPDPRSGGMPARPEPGEQPTPTSAPPAPGAGKLPPVPDGAEPAPLSARDAAAHLEAAAKRILSERQAYRRGKVKAAAEGVRDW